MSAPVPVFTRDEWHLFSGGATHGLTVLGFIINFTYARQQAVAGSGGGTFYFRDGSRGWHQTLAKGIVADDELVNYYSHDPRTSKIFVPWSKVQEWSRSLPLEILEQAKDIMARRRALYDNRPPMYPSIGRQYAWDKRPRGTDEEVERDRADLKAAQDQRDADMVPWREALDAIDAEAVALVESLAPTLLDDMLLEQRAAS